ncbi:hypothetical protein [Zobellella sp. DQSA1]|uniref:hypothetical protein n=1 Tax=Zobellella sp. DQSA1 TaxID=3342386 RepID=UPI0035C1568D
MIGYQIASGFRLRNANGQGAMQLTPEGRSMGAIYKFMPDGSKKNAWKCMADPDHLVDGGIKNRAIANNSLIRNTGVVTTGTISGHPSITMETIIRPYATDFDFNPDAWSSFFVFNTDLTEAVGGRELIRPLIVNTPGYAPRITIRTGGQFAVYDSNGNVRLEAAGVIQNNVTILMMATFSTRNGLKIFANGHQVAINSADKNPLDNQYHGGQFEMFRNSPTTNTQLGICGVLDIDLGWPEHAGYRRAIERFLMDKYGITA